MSNIKFKKTKEQSQKIKKINKSKINQSNENILKKLTDDCNKINKYNILLERYITIGPLKISDLEKKLSSLNEIYKDLTFIIESNNDFIVNSYSYIIYKIKFKDGYIFIDGNNFKQLKDDLMEQFKQKLEEKLTNNNKKEKRIKI